MMQIDKPILELESKIQELKKLSQDNNIDLSTEIDILTRKLENMKTQIYENLTPWQKVNLTRSNDRPTSKDYILNICSDFIELHGDRCFRDDLSIIGGIGLIDDICVTIIGHQKGKTVKENIARNFGMPHPEGYRKALRLMKQADKFNRPIITFIDTPGAYCGIGAEERGQGEAIARNLLEMSSLGVPIISIVIGEGGSGGALALGVCNKLAMLEHSIYSVISPEGLSSILWKDVSKASQAASIMKLTSNDLYELEVVDKIIKEPLGGAQKDVKSTSESIKKYIIEQIRSYQNLTREEIIDDRYKKFRKIGY
ncbi:acetyl-CoA carboxylase carboxyltransferase subunit alpha [Alkalithermobacter thermoalcaliphilus JW-YL-7 = DSM 7308]|uniref:Acetyl-coenzyme A carboxylase carboxyl transferase subunit alpha n=1 Tax=Alkalithermobacter thermoalcaliphilus JW-YL-7 = DSM 7308 TaxID=1121328 RepID=A0A150FS62_CLOPD|nr:Acetyl-coenzyme A carboxylase carboxyl transferase subunit alpha [[Clostridium] paradoxum JW-YL-7 = DSM 7308]SHK79375.1 acetyl-CoA carboxylase carboxyltransferase subunit alpha [[Clostridium] paradoxum JW-YL-7 = DSM 7308]